MEPTDGCRADSDHALLRVPLGEDSRALIREAIWSLSNMPDDEITVRRAANDLAEISAEVDGPTGKARAIRVAARIAALMLVSGVGAFIVDATVGGSLGNYLMWGVILGAAGVGAVGAIRATRGGPRGKSSLAWPSTGRAGSVEAGPSVVSPGDSQPCAGYELALLTVSPAPVVQFADSYTAGFRVRLVSGEIVCVTRGSLEISGARSTQRVSRRRARRHLRALGFVGRFGSIIPFQRAEKRILCANDRVEIVSELVSSGPAAEEERSSREGYPHTFVTRGRPRVRIVENTTQ